MAAHPTLSIPNKARIHPSDTREPAELHEPRDRGRFAPPEEEAAARRAGGNTSEGLKVMEEDMSEE
jgi:hypothetical protein